MSSHPQPRWRYRLPWWGGLIVLVLAAVALRACLPELTTAPGASGGRSPVESPMAGPEDDADLDPLLREFRQHMRRWEAARTGQRGGGRYDHFRFAEVIDEVAERQLREAVPDLIYGLNNRGARFRVNKAVEALVAMPDEAAIVTLLLHRHFDAIARIGRPVSPAILRELESGHRLRVLRGLYAIRLTTPEGLDHGLPRGFSDRGAALFELSPDVRQAVLRVMDHTDPHIRFDALITHLLVGGTPEAAAEVLGENVDRSTRFLLHYPGVVSADRRAVMYSSVARPYQHGEPGYEEGPELPDRHPPDPVAYTAWSPWTAIEDGLSLRIAMEDTVVTLDEPIYWFNAPVWIRMELRNDGDEPERVQMFEMHDFPLVVTWVHDRYGNAKALPYNLDADANPRYTTLAPGEAITWEFDVLQELLFARNGMYSIRMEPAPRSPELLRIYVQGLGPMLRSRRSHFGYDPRLSYFPRSIIPEPAPVVEPPDPPPPPDEESMDAGEPAYDR